MKIKKYKEYTIWRNTMSRKNKTMNKLILTSMLASTFVLTPVVSADDVDDYTSSIESIDQEISNLDSQAKQAEKELEALTNKIETNEEKIAESQALIEETKTKLDGLNEEIAGLEEIIANRQDQINQQARAVQTDGNPSNYITFVLESESLSDAFGRITVVNDMVSANTSLVEEQQTDKEAVEEKRSEEEKTLASFESTFTELEKASEELNEQKLAQEVLKNEVALAKADKESERNNIQSQLDNAIAAQEAYVAEQEQVAQANAQAIEVNTEVAQAQTESNDSNVEEETESVTTTRVASVTTNNSGVTGSSNTTNTSSTSSNDNTTSNTSSNASSSQASQASVGGGVAAAASIAHNYLGVPYVYGGTTPSGFDCSGLVNYVYAQAGVNIGARTAASQSAIGTEVGLSGAQPGDIVYWGGAGSAYHTGIYIGGGQYIHAPKPGDVVKIGSVQWYTPTGARRIN